MMDRRSNDSIYLGQESFRWVDDGLKFGVWEFMQMFFPENTNKKQFECAHKFMKTLFEAKTIESANFKEIVGSDYVNLTSIVIPKLERFGLIKISGERGKGKRYSIKLDTKFTDRIRKIGMEWFRVCAKYGDVYGD